MLVQFQVREGDALTGPLLLQGGLMEMKGVKTAMSGVLELAQRRRRSEECGVRWVVQVAFNLPLKQETVTSRCS